MIEEDYAKSQVQRYAGLDGFPHGQREAVRELICALQCFGTQEQAKKYTDDWLSTERECPKPVDIRRAAYALEEQDKARRREAWKPAMGLCSDCRDWGAFGWLLRGDRFEHCPNEALHQDDVSDALLDVLNSNRQREATKGLHSVTESEVRRVLGADIALGGGA